jgi:hypothetical protein
MVSPATAARRIQTKWRSTRSPVHTMSRLPLQVQEKILMSLTPVNRRALLDSLRKKSNLERYMNQIKTVKKKRRSQLQGLLLKASKVGRVTPARPNRMIKTYRGFVTAYRNITHGRKRLGSFNFPNIPNGPNLRLEFLGHYNNVKKHFMAPNARYARQPRNWQPTYGTANNWARVPPHMRRWTHWVVNNLGGDLNLERPIYTVNGVPVPV